MTTLLGATGRPPAVAAGVRDVVALGAGILILSFSVEIERLLVASRTARLTNALLGRLDLAALLAGGLAVFEVGRVGLLRLVGVELVLSLSAVGATLRQLVIGVSSRVLGGVVNALARLARGEIGETAELRDGGSEDDGLRCGDGTEVGGSGGDRGVVEVGEEARGGLLKLRQAALWTAEECQ